VKKLLPISKRRIVEDTYEFKEDLGVGHYSVVKKAVHKKTGEVVAIKIYDKRHIPLFDKGCISAEVEILKSLKHSNVIYMKEAYATPKKLYIVLEYMEGGELLDLIRKRKVFPEREASKIFFQVISALGYLHSMGIVHRDIKPDNLLLTTTSDDAVVKLADFGFAKRIGDGVLHTPCGSPVYTAPEIVREEPYNQAVDMWSAGVLLYILLCGFPPFYHRDPNKLFDVIEKGVFDFPDPQWTNISNTAKELVSGLLTLDPANRLTAQQVLLHPWFNQNPDQSNEKIEVKLEKATSEKSLSSEEASQYTGSAYSVWKRTMDKGKEPYSFPNGDSSVEAHSGELNSATSSFIFEVRIDEESVKSDSSQDDFL
jgi:calcium/calmodulin-dependent protein kinase I